MRTTVMPMLLLLSMFLSGCASKSVDLPWDDAEEQTTAIVLDFSTQNGARSFQLSSATPITATFLLRGATDLDQYRPLQITLVSEEFGVEFGLTGFEADLTHWGFGSTAYVGQGDASVSTPGIRSFPIDYNANITHRFNASAGLLVVAWANQVAPHELAILLAGDIDVEETPPGAARSFWMRDGGCGLRVGLEAVGGFHEGSCFDLPPPKGSWILVLHHYHGNVGTGKLTVNSGSFAEEVELTGMGDVASRGITADFGRHVLVTTEPVEMRLNYAGSFRHTKLYGIAIETTFRMPTVWQEEKLELG